MATGTRLNNDPSQNQNVFISQISKAGFRNKILNLKIRHKLFIGFFLLIMFGLIIAISIVPALLSRNMEDGINERIDDILNVSSNAINDTKREVLLCANLVSSRKEVIDNMDWLSKVDKTTRIFQLTRILSLQAQQTDGESPQAIEIIPPSSFLGKPGTIKAIAAAASYQYLDQRTVSEFQKVVDMQTSFSAPRIAKNAEIKENDKGLAIIATAPIISPPELIRPWSISGMLTITYPLDDNFISNLQRKIDDTIHLTLYKIDSKKKNAISVATTITNENGESLTGRKISPGNLKHIFLTSETEQYHIEDTVFDKTPYRLSYSLLQGNGGAIGLLEVAIPTERILKETQKIRNRIYHITILGTFLAFAVIIWISKSINRPLAQLITGTEMVAKGDFKQRIKILSQDELGLLAEKFNWMTENIQRQQKELLKKRQIEQELKVAQAIQARILPQAAPSIDGIDIAFHAVPAKEVGGDLFDFLYDKDEAEKSRLGIVIGDVSGKSVPAALYMTMTKILIQALSENRLGPEVVLTDINRLMSKNMDYKTFITLFYANIDLKNKVMSYANAGHNPPVIFRKETAKANFIEEAEIETAALGIQSDFIFIGQTLKIEKGDILFFYTDGLTEAMNTAQELYGDPRLLDVICKYHHLPAAQIVSKISESINEFRNGEVQADDITFIVIKM